MRAKRNKSREKYGTASRTSVRKQVYIRHPLDRYVTGAAAIEALFSVLRRNASFASVKCAVDICGGILDPVSLAIASEVPSARVLANDINPALADLPTMTRFDATGTNFVENLQGVVGQAIDIIVSSPPYSHADAIVQNAILLAEVVAMMVCLGVVCVSNSTSCFFHS